MSCVLDASALLAFLQGEPGADRIADVLARRAVISAINYAEALGKLADDSETAEDVAHRLEAEGFVGGVLGVEPVLAEDAPAVAALLRSTRHVGLSLGDRACLVLALRLRLPVLTADRAWQELSLDVDVEAIR